MSKIKTVQRYETEDGRIHETEEEARTHQVFLDVKDVLVPLGKHHCSYDVIRALASRYNFVPRQ